MAGAEAGPAAPSAYGLDVWDAHACLNALNRCILQSTSPAENEALHAVADHLKLLAHAGKLGGMLTGDLLSCWVRSLVALQAQGAIEEGSACVTSIQLAPSVAAVEVGAIGRVLIPLLRAHPGAQRIVILCEEPAAGERCAHVRISLDARVNVQAECSARVAPRGQAVQLAGTT